MKTETELREERWAEEDERFTKFTNELAKLSKKYDISLDICGGVNIYTPKTIKKISYSNDSSSGDLFSYVTT